MTELGEQAIAEALKRRLSEQDELKKRFDLAKPADLIKDDIDLGEAYRRVTEFRMDRNSFLIKHIPTEILGQWSAMTGPRQLRESVEKWVDEIQTTFPKKAL